MASFNKVVLVGNLTRDPEVRYITSGAAVSEIGLAVNRQWTDRNSNERKEETTFVDVTLWGRQAELCSQYLSKGSPVLIEGRLQLDQWEDQQTGQKRSKLKVVGEHMQFLSSRRDETEQRPRPASQQGQARVAGEVGQKTGSGEPQPYWTQTSTYGTDSVGDPSFYDDSVPF